MRPFEDVDPRKIAWAELGLDCDSPDKRLAGAFLDDDDDDFDEENVALVSGRGEGIMDESLHAGSGAARRNEDIALDLMKFVAMTTGYGRTTSTGLGFQGSGSAAKPEEYADRLLELYGKCLSAVGKM